MIYTPELAKVRVITNTFRYVRKSSKTVSFPNIGWLTTKLRNRCRPRLRFSINTEFATIKDEITSNRFLWRKRCDYSIWIFFNQEFLQP